MNTKICLAALFAAVATTANAQEPKFCQPGCGGQHSGQNSYICSCCHQYEVNVSANFDACCASSCDIGSPCKWEDLGSGSSVAFLPSMGLHVQHQTGAISKFAGSNVAPAAITDTSKIRDSGT